MHRTIPNLKLAKQLNILAVVITIAVYSLVGLMRRVKLDISMDTSWMPAFHAICNTVVAVCLIAAIIYIKKKNVPNHRRAIYTAMLFSLMFLISYVVYHFTTEEVRYCKMGWTRTLYFVLLVSHIILAGISLPFILFTFIKGYTHQYSAHRRMARWVFPIWLYVAITGPLSFLMLMDCY